MIAFSLLLFGSAAVAPTDAALSKGVDAFRECFARRQEVAGLPWGFVPTASGGTFSNAGARGVTAPYHLLVRAKEGRTVVQLIADRPDRDLVEAVEQCR